MMSYIVRSAWHLVVFLFGTGGVDLVIQILAGQTNSATAPDLSHQPLETCCSLGHAWWSNGRSKLRYDDNNDKWSNLAFALLKF